MKILLALRSVQQAEGGPITAAIGLAAALIERGHHVTIAAHDDGLGLAARDGFVPPRGAEICLFELTRRIWEHSKSYAQWLAANVHRFDLVVINSAWISHVHFASRVCRENSIPYVIRPHGCLTREDMSHHSFRKKLYYLLEERRNLESALFVHCTAGSEAEDARALGLTNIVTIPLGVDRDLLTLDRGRIDRNRVLFIGRIAAKKGVDVLIRALATDPAVAGELRLDVLGVDHRGLQPELERLAASLGVADRVVFHGHADKKRRDEFLQDARMVALPSKDENFGLAVAEAMAAGVPVVISPHVSHAPLVKEYRAGRVVGRNEVALAGALADIAAMTPDDYAAMGQRARSLVRDHYSWERTAASLERHVVTALDTRAR